MDQVGKGKLKWGRGEQNRVKWQGKKPLGWRRKSSRLNLEKGQNLVKEKIGQVGKGTGKHGPRWDRRAQQCKVGWGRIKQVKVGKGKMGQGGKRGCPAGHRSVCGFSFAEVCVFVHRGLGSSLSQRR